MKTTGIIRICNHREPYAFIKAVVEIDADSRSGHILYFWVYAAGDETKVQTWAEAKALFDAAIAEVPK